ncbi:MULTISPECIES: sigma-70 family RNA polymerase sigma factor [unclassified Clostridium]|uniref:RNA polymerase sigma factor n=1 Tax=unclassified Clostridium TaxID=2614128 RepID=UPI001CCB7EA0|nr:sigma-70 family RNA polymerase sigma factor [Clostridium sp. M14]KAI3344524.1 sigma-70 family RNA polymerase sigma factor [Clostridium botulinum]MBZ9693150.1 sigma-70 family RNA polymerase sigma factor [Clostridium sp. M14]
MVPLKKLKRRYRSINDETCNLIKKILLLIYKYLISIGASKEDAEDIMQETFIKTYENIDILIGGNLKAWMFKVSINKFYTLYKKSRTNLFLTDELSYTLKSDFEISDIDNSIDINKVLSKMSESHKNLLILKYSMDLSYNNIGKLLNISEGSAKTLCYRARNVFKKIWESEKYE